MSFSRENYGGFHAKVVVLNHPAAIGATVSSGPLPSRERQPRNPSQHTVERVVPEMPSAYSSREERACFTSRSPVFTSQIGLMPDKRSCRTCPVIRRNIELIGT
jgi:hypothetical protein